MYQKYHTDALVLKSREHGEADRVLVLYTKDFGLVWARSSAVRTEASRMRYSLQNYTRASISLVRGRHGWRVAGAVSLRGGYGEKENVSTFARIAELAMRLVAGEEENPYLFAVLAEAHDTLMQGTCPGRATIEIVCVARILYALGYLSAEALGTALFTHTAYASEHLHEAEVMREELLSQVNRAISETHL